MDKETETLIIGGNILLKPIVFTIFDYEYMKILSMFNGISNDILYGLDCRTFNGVPNQICSMLILEYRIYLEFDFTFSIESLL